VAEFKVPELGENVAGGDVASVLVKVGDTIAVDQPVVELETDKATVEVPSSVAGRVTDIKVKPGDKVNVGAVILVVEDGAAATSQSPKPTSHAEENRADAPTTPEADATESKAREARTEGPGAREAKAAEPDAAEPDAAEANAAEPEAEESDADKPRPEAPTAGQSPAPVAGSLQASGKKPEKVVSMPARQAAESSKPAPRAEAAEAQPRPKVETAKPRAESPRPQAAPAAPSVRRLAREVGVNIDEVQGSGPQGRISEEDVKEHARRILTSVGTSAVAARALQERPGVALPDFSRWGEIERKPMSNIRRTTAERLSYAWNTVAHVTQFEKADITSMEELRRKYREQVSEAGGNLTVTAMLVKVLATAVKQFPQFNTSLDSQANEIIYKQYVNVGVAVDTDRGLLVPVVRNADQKNITNIAIEVHQLAEKARNRKLTLEEMSGGGITISNLGGIGGTYFTPIVNWPEVAILGVSRGIIEPVWRNDPSTGSGQGTFEPRQLLPLSLSYDHRVIDGADAMRFLRWVVEAIEQPFLLSLEG
jgi:pyruvate dehydrogenase E2 component (dihydrolipoamide acetyltransferase)